jgi:hypothetical protein
MLPDSFANRHKSYLSTYGHPASTAGVEHYRTYMRGGTGGAYDAQPRSSRPSRIKSFEEVYRVRLGSKGETIALDQHDPQRDGPLQVDADPAAQREVETTDNQPDHGPKGAAPPWGLSDEPRHERVTEPDTTMGLDPYTEKQRRAFGAASHNGKLGIDPDFARRALHEDAALETVTHGQQGSEVGPESWSRTRGRDQEHEDEEQDQDLIDQRLTKLLQRLDFDPATISAKVARDRKRRAADRARKAKDQGPIPFRGMPEPGGKVVGDSASFARMYGSDVTRLQSHGSGAVAFTPKVFIHRSRG